MNDLYNLSDQLGKLFLKSNQTIAACESCTGGWLSQVITAIDGSSNWFDRGFVTYSNEAKIEQLGVDPELIEQFGAVSQEVAEAMAVGGLLHSNATVTIAITGIAGPTGGTKEKPVGTVWFGFAKRGNGAETFLKTFEGDRESIRKQAVLQSLQFLLERVSHG